MSSKPYYDKFFPDGVEGYESEDHLLLIFIKQGVTTEMLEAVGLVADGKNDCEGDFYIDEDGLPLIELVVPAAYEDGELSTDWVKEVPSLIGLKPDWVEGCTING